MDTSIKKDYIIAVIPEASNPVDMNILNDIFYLANVNGEDTWVSDFNDINIIAFSDMDRLRSYLLKQDYVYVDGEVGSAYEGLSVRPDIFLNIFGLQPNSVNIDIIERRSSVKLMTTLQEKDIVSADADSTTANNTADDTKFKDIYTEYIETTRMFHCPDPNCDYEDVGPFPIVNLMSCPVCGSQLVPILTP